MQADEPVQTGLQIARFHTCELLTRLWIQEQRWLTSPICSRRIYKKLEPVFPDGEKTTSEDYFRHIAQFTKKINLLVMN
ncbi:hypothetical protein Shel_05090 [Slackia heliotrinireducens DSM 20476]|uniref:Uncharacterized protein n=1 Tax=Slackia heliotrinireducens (strain ATCC 29202 / DSM 20476 / NCTC 11029 / RHS 1) TaxID=471855 RepID=C7N348_SLAHD|nr:hypothetical protein Shel_05090 [Slackia heliotrinireducens DSM 20476]